MPVTDALPYLHYTGNYLPDTLCYAGTQESDFEIDFGAQVTGTAYPYLPAFPSLTEKTYTFPPEVVGQGGVDMGIHVIVGAAFNTLTSVLFNVQSAATTAATAIIGSRSLTLAQLGVVGAHYYIPLSLNAVLRFLRWNAVLTGSDPTTGTILSWFGPRTGGEQ